MIPFLRNFLMLLLVVSLPYQQIENGITAPQAGETISGVVTVTGTAVHPNYLRYELAFLYLDAPGADWIVFAEGDQPVANGTLAIWDTEVGRAINAPIFPDGRYQLRLRVVKTDFNYDEYFLSELIIQNDGPTPTPTPDETAVSLTATASQNLPPQPNSDSESSFQQATPLPSLTPLPTPTPPATPVGNVAPATAVPEAPSGGLIEQVGNQRWSKVGSAFLIGIIGTAVLFGLGILYVILRAIGRRLWRMVIYQRNKTE